MIRKLHPIDGETRITDEEANRFLPPPSLSLSLSFSFSFSDENVYVKEYKSGILVPRNIRYARLVSDGNCPLKVSISALDIKGASARSSAGITVARERDLRVFSRALLA